MKTATRIPGFERTNAKRVFNDLRDGFSNLDDAKQYAIAYIADQIEVDDFAYDMIEQLTESTEAPLLSQYLTALINGYSFSTGKEVMWAVKFEIKSSGKVMVNFDPILMPELAA